MAEQKVTGDEVVVEVEFNQQQDVVLRQLREEGRYGSTDAEIIRNFVHEFLRAARLL
jgi:hypothetical protein